MTPEQQQILTQLFIVYDQRAVPGFNTDDAAILVSCSSLKEARSYRHDFKGGHVYRYDTTPNRYLVNETYMEQL